MLVGGLTILELKCLDSISLPVGEHWSAQEERMSEGETPLSLAFLWSSWIAAGIFLVICVGPRWLPLLNCVHFGDLVYHLNKKLAD